MTKYEKVEVDLPSFVHTVFDPTERLKDLSDVRREGGTVRALWGLKVDPAYFTKTCRVLVKCGGLV